MRRFRISVALRTRTSIIAASALIAGILTIPAPPASAAGPTTHFSVVATDAGPTAGDTVELTVTALDASEATDDGYTGTVHVTVSNPQVGETLPQDYTFQSSDNGVATITGTLTLAGSRTITVKDASDAGIMGTTGVTVGPDVANKLSFSSQPSDTYTQHKIAPFSVQILDQYGNQTADNDTIQLTVNSGSFDSGTNPKTASGGAVTFSNLKINTPGTYTLTASDNTNESVADATSDSFDILAHADIALTMSASPDGSIAHPAIAGTDEVYTLAVTNDGPDMNSSYSVTASIPIGTTLVSDPGCTGSGPITCSGGPLDNGGSDQFAITLHIKPNYAGSDDVESLSFSASVSLTSPTQDPDNVVTNDTATVTFDVVGRADLSITKTAKAQQGTSQDIAYANDDASQNRVTFTVKVKNANASSTGPSDAQAVVVTDTVPTGTSFVSAESSTQCSFAAGVVTCSETGSPPLAPGASRTYTIVVAVSSTLRGGEDNNFTNTAEVTSTTTDINNVAYPKSSTTGTIRVHTVPDAPTNQKADPGNLNAFYQWKHTLSASTNGGESIDYFAVTVTGPSAPSVGNVNINDPCGTSGTQSIFCTNVSPLQNNQLYTFSVQAHNAVGLSDAVTDSTTPSINNSAKQIGGGTLTQQTGNGAKPTAGDPIITTQTFNSGTAGIGLLQEHAAPTNFCGGKCIGGTVLVNKLEDPNAPTGFYQVNILYYKSLINGTGIKAIVYFAPNDTDPTGSQLPPCPSKINTITTDCAIVKLGNQGANPALRIVVYTNRIDPTIGARGIPK